MKIRRVNLDLQKQQYSGSPKKNQYKQLTSKRLKYRYQKNQKRPNNDTTLTNQFNDHQYFSAPKNIVDINVKNNTSNLLIKSQIKTTNNSLQKTKKEIPIQISLNNQCYDIKNYSSNRKQIKYVNFPTSKHLIPDSFRQKFQQDNDQQTTKPKLFNNNVKINPYTNQQYLYYRKKQKQKYKKTLDQLKKKQQLSSILKPCQIFQKQLNLRQIRPQTQRSLFRRQHKNKQFVRSKTANPISRSQNGFGLQPWEISSNLNQQEIF